MNKETEFESTVRLADRILDRPYGDPDDDLGMLSRQFLRAMERIDILLPMAKAFAHENNVGKNREMVDTIEDLSLKAKNVLTPKDY